MIRTHRMNRLRQTPSPTPRLFPGTKSSIQHLASSNQLRSHSLTYRPPLSSIVSTAEGVLLTKEDHSQLRQLRWFLGTKSSIQTTIRVANNPAGAAKSWRAWEANPASSNQLPTHSPTHRLTHSPLPFRPSTAPTATPCYPLGRL